MAIAVTVLVTPGSRRHHGDAEFAREFRVGVRHVNGGGFMTDVDDPDPKLRSVVPDRLDMSALQSEDAIDPALLEETRDPGRAGIVIGIEISGARGHLALQ